MKVVVRRSSSPMYRNTRKSSAAGVVLTVNFSPSDANGAEFTTKREFMKKLAVSVPSQQRVY